VPARSASLLRVSVFAPSTAPSTSTTAPTPPASPWGMAAPRLAATTATTLWCSATNPYPPNRCTTRSVAAE
jgi:hypothetical protein